MKKAGFRYQRHTKSYYVDRHEDPDVVADRNQYVTTSLPLEVYEHCWIQRMRWQYLNLEMKKKTNNENMKKEHTKKEKGVEQDYTREVEKFIADERVHFFKNKEGTEMVEEHVADV